MALKIINGMKKVLSRNFIFIYQVFDRNSVCDFVNFCYGQMTNIVFLQQKDTSEVLHSCQWI